MLSNDALTRSVYQRYIQPTQRKKRPFVGVELEFPVVNLNKEPVDFAVVHRLAEAFSRQFGFTRQKRDDEGHIYAADAPENGDCLSFDCSYNTLELSFGPEADINRLSQRFRTYYDFLQGQLLSERHTLTGMGINPHWDRNHNVPVPNGRYRMLFHHLSSYPKYGNQIPFHHYPNYGLFACASQVQLDVEEDAILETLQTFAKLEPFKSLLFANSLFPCRPKRLLSRDFFWASSLHGLNPKNVGFYDGVDSVEGLVRYLKETSLFCVERGDQYINFPPTPLQDYFAAESITGEYFAHGVYHQITFSPQLEDLAYLRSYKLEDLTFRGTVEFRSVCQQPVSQVMASAAFHAGLSENLQGLTALLEQDHSLYGHGYSAAALREMMNRGEYPDFFQEKQVSETLCSILDLAGDGLKKRGFSEAHFIAPLYKRAEQLLSPAKEMLLGLEHGKTIDDYIGKFAE